MHDEGLRTLGQITALVLAAGPGKKRSQSVANTTQARRACDNSTTLACWHKAETRSLSAAIQHLCKTDCICNARKLLHTSIPNS